MGAGPGGGCGREGEGLRMGMDHPRDGDTKEFRAVGNLKLTGLGLEQLVSV